MDARKLVGMTEGAKKRAARNGQVIHHIGSRLSQLPKTHWCVNCRPVCEKCEDQDDDNIPCVGCGSAMTTDNIFCNGVGVVSVNDARSRKVRR